ncbi:MAG: DUF6273 domain-containing protein [Lachnospiraceae bacterium]|nr:DUF6273 domain-containing protein [Lachnospiraceae bacterium]
MKKKANMCVGKRVGSMFLAGLMVTGMVPQSVVHGAVNNNRALDMVADEKPVLYKDGDKVWFGNYPQAEVVPSKETYTAVDEANLSEGDLIVSDSLYKKLKETKEWDMYGDTVIDGQKYRRVSKDKCCYGIAAKSKETAVYTWDEEQYHYFKYEPIEWKIYSSDEDSLYVISDKIIENEGTFGSLLESDKNGWETSYIRSWLNGYGSDDNNLGADFSGYNFMDIAFDDSEQKAISTSFLRNDDNTQLGSEAYYEDVIDTNDTEDKIYLLSLTELYKELGTRNFSEESSTYSKARGTVFNANFFITRTFGEYGMPIVFGEDLWGAFRGDKYRGIYPAMKIDNVDVIIENVDSVEEVESRNYNIEDTKYNAPGFEVYSCQDSNLTSNYWKTDRTLTWNCIWMGSYPQSEVDEQTKEMLDGLMDSTDWNYDDAIVVGGNKYQRVGNDSGYRYFKYEPIKWRIISREDNEALVMADKNLDIVELDSYERAKPWEESRARDYLNNKFCDVAFDDNEEKAIKKTLVIDENKYGNDTMDRVFLLSNDEIDSKLGFNAGYKIGGVIRYYLSRPENLERTDAFDIVPTNIFLTRTPGYTMGNHGPAVSLIDSSSSGLESFILKPVMRINLLENNSFKYAGTICSNGIDNEVGIDEQVVEEPTVSIEGVQISAVNEGFRIIYDTTSNDDIVERGLIYGLADYADKDKMTVDSDSDTVHHYSATGKGLIGIAPDYNKRTYAMTMKLIKNKQFYESPLMVRAYAVQKDGTVLYSEVEQFDIFSCAKYLYERSLMNSQADHEYLYNSILKVVDGEYVEKAYDTSL